MVHEWFDAMWFHLWHRPTCRLLGVAPRSSHWPAVRRAFLQGHPRCAATGDTRNLDVHHIQPFHIRPSLELDPANLIVLRRDVHYVLGHGGRSWADTNPDVAIMAAELKVRVQNG